MSTKISQLTSAVDVTANDLIQIVDVEDGVMAPSGTNKKTTASLLANQLVPLINAGAIAGSKIADSGITSAKIANDTIVNADINSSAAIAGTKISPDFGSQNIITTGTLSANVGSVISGSSASDALRITQTGAGNAIIVEDSDNPDSTPLAVDAAGRLLVGTITARSIGAGAFGILHVERAGIAIATITTNSNDEEPSYLILGKSRGTSVGSDTIVQNGDRLGEIRFAGGDGTDMISIGATISAQVDGIPSVNDIPGRLIFLTTPGGSASPVEAMRINSAGNVGIGATSIESNCLLKLQSTTKGFRPPSMTTTERNAISTPIAGLMIYNNSTNKLNFYNGSAWEAVTSAV
jgi:hypothetical protein